MIITIHQPNYLPWLGFFAKIQMSDIFVFHDAVQFSGRTFTKRTKIRKAKDSATTTWLTVPVRQHTSAAPIHAIEVEHATDWAQAHLRKIRNTYAGAPFFSTVYLELEKVLNEAGDYMQLADLNIEMIKSLSQLIGIKADWRRSSSLNVKGTAEELNFNIVEALGGTVYLSGTGAKKYQKGDVFEGADVLLQYVDAGQWLEDHPYAQGDHPFVPGLSITDALMHVGVDGVRDMLSSIERDASRTQ